MTKYTLYIFVPLPSARSLINHNIPIITQCVGKAGCCAIVVILYTPEEVHLHASRGPFSAQMSPVAPQKPHIFTCPSASPSIVHSSFTFFRSRSIPFAWPNLEPFRCAISQFNFSSPSDSLCVAHRSRLHSAVLVNFKFGKYFHLY